MNWVCLWPQLELMKLKWMGPWLTAKTTLHRSNRPLLASPLSEAKVNK